MGFNQDVPERNHLLLRSDRPLETELSGCGGCCSLAAQVASIACSRRGHSLKGRYFIKAKVKAEAAAVIMSGKGKAQEKNRTGSQQTNSHKKVCVFARSSSLRTKRAFGTFIIKCVQKNCV